MDVLFLSRLQFAVATIFHFIFVPLTLGLSILTAIMETKFVTTGDEDYRRMAKFWGKLFLINFAIGIVTGITLEFQFGTNWSRYSSYVGDIFGSLLAIEATVAFFLESTFVAVWVFGWNKVSKKFHAAAIWIVAIASNISAYWIITANSWMQHPVGYTLRNGRAELTNFMDVVLSGFTVTAFLHTVFAAYILAGFFVMGISAFHLLRNNEMTFFKKSFRIGATFALIFAILEVLVGHYSGVLVAQHQPTKLAAMEAIWETDPNPPMYMLLIPDEANERNSVEVFGIPGMLRLLAAHGDRNAVIKGLKDFPRDERPPVAISFFSFRLMVGLGFLFVLLAFLAWMKRQAPEKTPWLMKLLIYAIPLPYIAIELGWTLTEVGRQPWIVYGLMKTSDAVSITISTTQVFITLLAFIIVYSLLGAADIYLLFTNARKGPVPARAE